MGAPELFLEHKYGDKVRKYLRVKPQGTKLFVIGSSRQANLRIAGDGVSSCHAVLKYKAPHWYICHISPDQDTLIENQSQAEVEHLIDQTTTVKIGQHQFRLSPNAAAAQIFTPAPKQSVELRPGQPTLHQVVIVALGQIIETRLLKNTEPLRYNDGIEEHFLAAPTSGDWIETKIGARVVKQRLVPEQEIVSAEGLTVDRPLSRTFAVLILLLLLLLFLGPLVPQADKQPQAVLDQKSLDIIFNAKTIKKKREESKKLVASSSAKMKTTGFASSQNQQNHTVPEESTAPTISPRASKALNSLRESGLSALIGKIAKRANKQGVLVAATGTSPDNANAGRAFFSQGTSTVGGGGSASKAAAGFKLGGVGTQGKAGGAVNFKQGTGLSGGSVGQGDVAIDDEETTIEGGLDRDVIAEVIRRNLGQIRYCYERQLSSNRDLYGKIIVKFNILSAGEVGDPKIDSSTMKSAMVEGCVLRRLAGWKFPSPKGGTTVKVSYPFLFKALD